MNAITGLFLLPLGILSFSYEDEVDLITDPLGTKPLPTIDTFSFSSNGTIIEGKIFVPSAYETNKNEIIKQINT